MLGLCGMSVLVSFLRTRLFGGWRVKNGVSSRDGIVGVFVDKGGPLR